MLSSCRTKVLQTLHSTMQSLLDFFDLFDLVILISQIAKAMIPKNTRVFNVTFSDRNTPFG